MNPNIHHGPSHALFFEPFLLTILLLAFTVAILPYWFIFKKAGFSPWLSLLMAVPLVNLAVLYVVAFSQWKVAPAPSGYPAIPSQGPGYPPMG